jgi:hypothetical protein
MPTLEGHVETERPSRYLAQLCRHADQMTRLRHRPRSHGDGGAAPEVRHVEWSETHGTVSLPWGTWTVETTTSGLTLRVEAADEKGLRQIQDLVAGRLENIGRRDRLKVIWEAPALRPGEAAGIAPAPTEVTAARRGHRVTIGLVAVGALAAGTHLILGGAALSVPRGTSSAADVVLAVVVVKLAALGVLAIRRGKASKARRD